MFSYTESTYDTLSYEVDMNGDLVNAAALTQVYQSVVDDPTGGVGHFVFGDVRGYYKPSTGKGTLQVFVKVAYDKNPWDDRSISVESREAGNDYDCLGNIKPAAYKMAASKALAKYRNQVSYNPNHYVYHTNVITLHPVNKKLPGMPNALFPAHTKGNLHPSDCIFQNQMEAYRDEIFSDLYNQNGFVLDCALIFNTTHDGTLNNTGSWTWFGNTVTTNFYGIEVGHQGYTQSPGN